MIMTSQGKHHDVAVLCNHGKLSSWRQDLAGLIFTSGFDYPLPLPPLARLARRDRRYGRQRPCIMASSIIEYLLRLKLMKALYSTDITISSGKGCSFPASLHILHYARNAKCEINMEMFCFTSNTTKLVWDVKLTLTWFFLTFYAMGVELGVKLRRKCAIFLPAPSNTSTSVLNCMLSYLLSSTCHTGLCPDG